MGLLRSFALGIATQNDPLVQGLVALTGDEVAIATGIVVRAVGLTTLRTIGIQGFSGLLAWWGRLRQSQEPEEMELEEWANEALDTPSYGASWFNNGFWFTMILANLYNYLAQRAMRGTSVAIEGGDGYAIGSSVLGADRDQGMYLLLATLALMPALVSIRRS